MTTSTAKSIREHCFSTPLPYHAGLAELCGGDRSHSFLVNPASQNTYLYLTEYVLKLSGQWFGKDVSRLRFLDWGCGKGHVTHLLRERTAHVTSCDVDDASSDSSFGQPTPILTRQGIHVVPLRHEYLLPFESASFDIVLSVGVLEHVPRERESLRELCRVLRPGGLFFVFICLKRSRGPSWQPGSEATTTTTAFTTNASFCACFATPVSSQLTSGGEPFSPKTLSPIATTAEWKCGTSACAPCPLLDTWPPTLSL